MSTARSRQQRTIVLVALAATALSGCGFRGASSIPLPGGQGNGSDAYQVTIEFSDVLDLVQQSAVKVNDVTIGSVRSIEADGYTARVVVNVNGDIVLPANTRASLRQTSLRGEKFVSFEAPPASESFGRLRGGETISLDQTTRSAEIEEVLSALSLVLNGGSLEQLQVINSELVLALEGRSDRVKSLLGELDTFVGGLDDQKGQIVRVLDSLDRLSTRLVDERTVIATALEDIPEGVAVLTEQREEITRVLTSLDTLGDVAVRVINASQADTVADLTALQPILTQLNAAGKALPESLEILTTYPFPRTVTEGIKGDYANLFVTGDLDLRGLGRLTGLPLEELPIPLPPEGDPGTPILPPLPAIPGLPPLVPLPGIPQLPLGTPGANSSPSAGTGGIPLLPLPGSRLPIASGAIASSAGSPSPSPSPGLLRLLLGGLS